jgi:hypothetical protein
MRRALIVGIDDYSFGPLSGCVNDANKMHDLLSFHQNGGRNFDCVLLTAPSGKITKADLKRTVEANFRNGDDIDIALFYFAGHGIQTNTGGAFVTQDASQYDEGLAMNEVLTLASRATGIREIVVIADCCHSGQMGQTFTEAAQVSLRKGLSILTSSRENHTSLEMREGGMFTSRVCEALDGGAADILGEVTVASVYSYVHQLFGATDQRPMFKANLSKLAPLRKCTPAIAIETLYKLPNYFSEPDREYALDPSYEPTAIPHSTENELIFSQLQKYRAARLLEPVGEEHLFWAAINSKACKLTPLGKYYWTLAKDKRLT